jgi:hypothetical protein
MCAQTAFHDGRSKHLAMIVQVNPPENCGGANSTQRYGQPLTWGWGDQNCANNYIFMCRIQGGHALRPNVGMRCKAPMLLLAAMLLCKIVAQRQHISFMRHVYC